MTTINTLNIDTPRTGNLSESYYADETIRKWASMTSGNYGALSQIIEQRKQSAIVYLKGHGDAEYQEQCITMMKWCNIEINKHIQLVF